MRRTSAIVLGATLGALVIPLTGCSRHESKSAPTPNAQPPSTSAPNATEAKDATHGAQEHASAKPETPEAPPAPEPAPASSSGARDAARLALGQQMYVKGQCAMCHGPDAQGTRFGPDLITWKWAHSDGSVQGIVAILKAGIPKEDFKDTAYAMKMPSATPFIPSEDDLVALAEYVLSLRK